MTRDELEEFIETAIFKSEPLGRIAWKKLLAIVELHKPFEFHISGEPYMGCKCGEEYPCPTIQAIEKELQ